MVFGIDGTLTKTIFTKDFANNPRSALFIDNTSLCIAAENVLLLIDFDSENTKHITNGQFSDLCYSNSTVFALNFGEGKVLVKAANEWFSDGYIIDTGLVRISAASTCVATLSSIFICDNQKSVYEFALDGKRLHVIECGLTYPTICGFNMNSDVLMTDMSGEAHILSATKKMVACHVTGLEWLLDVVDVAFLDGNTFWILDCLSSFDGKYKLIKCIIK